MQIGEALGYRWQREDETLGFDVDRLPLRRELADTVELTGTATAATSICGRERLPRSVSRSMAACRSYPATTTKKSTARALYGEWHNATVIAQITWQNVAGLKREGWELELGYRCP